MALPRFGQVYQPTSVGNIALRTQVFAESRLNKGIINSLDSADIDNGACQNIINGMIRFDKTSRRYGMSLIVDDNDIPIVKPDSEPVLALIFISKKDGTPYTVRFTPTTVHRIAIDVWSPMTGTLLGGQYDRIQAVNVLDELIFSNNGANNIQKVDFTGESFGDLGNAPAYRYITGFYNRAVGAARRDANEVEVGWSGDNNIDEWDPTVDETAGSSPILESTSDLSDFITGIYAFTNNMILLREHSIWVVTKQPIPTLPFNFQTAFPGIGCNAPNSVGVIPNGLCWLDTRTRTVWGYVPGSAPERIGFNIEKSIVESIDPAICFGSYSGINNEYSLCLPTVGTDVVKEYTYNFHTKSWVYAERKNITCVDDVDYGSGGVTIDELVGTIEELVGTIDELSPSSVAVGKRLYGLNDGDILLEDSDVDTDNGEVYETVIDSKSFVLPTLEQNIQEYKLEILPHITGDIKIYYSKNGGADSSQGVGAASFVLARTIPAASLEIEKPQLITIKRPQKCRRFAWRIYANSGQFDVINYELITTRSASSNNSDNSV